LPSSSLRGTAAARWWAAWRAWAGASGRETAGRTENRIGREDHTGSAMYGRGGDQGLGPGGDAEVGKLDQTLLGGEDVGALDVTVDHSLRVQVAQPLQHLLRRRSQR
jgi:hypothetical protein